MILSIDLKNVMEKQPLNINSKKEETILQGAVEKLFLEVKTKYPLPKYWEYGFSKHLTLDFAKQIKVITYGYSLEDLNYLPDGRRVEPDGGFLYLIKRDSSGNIEKIYPLLITEAKHQDSGSGNAIERYFKNFNFYADLLKWEKIFPYVTFAVGKDFDKETVKVKFKVGGSNEITNNTDNIQKVAILAGKETEYKPKILLLTKDDFSEWKEDEIYYHIRKVFDQSYDYFSKIIAEKNDFYEFACASI